MRTTEGYGRMEWARQAEVLAGQVAEPDSRWLAPVASVPRHELVPRWWEGGGSGEWVLRDGAGDPAAWARAAYADRTLVTGVGGRHADHARAGERVEGPVTSCAAEPGAAVRLLRHGRLGDGLSFLDLGTGAGSVAAYAAWRYGAERVTSLDVDPYVTGAAADRLARMGLLPRFVTADATERVPGTYDRVVAGVGLPAGAGLRPVLAALEPGGRLVTGLARTSLIVTGWKDGHGVVVGRVERDMARSVAARSVGAGRPAIPAGLFAQARSANGSDRRTGRFPVVDIAGAWELRSMLEVTVPGVEVAYESDGRTRRTLLVHPDGSWARAEAERTEPPEVHQRGRQRLWTALERIRTRLNAEGSLPLLGAHVRITADGVVRLFRGKWQVFLGD